MTQADLFGTPPPIKAPRFDGHAYVAGRDHDRLTHQLDRIRDLMLDGRWRTVEQISVITGDPQTSASAQLRNLRKERFGSYILEKRHIARGLFEYRILRGNP